MCIWRSILVLSYLIICNVSKVCLLEQCSKDECPLSSNIEENKYSEAANSKHSKYLKEAEDALVAYKPCLHQNCSCLLSTLTEDLKSFQKSRITKEMFESVRKKGTKYQIIDGKVYRQSECTFPSRCSGVEYFLLQLAGKLPNVEMIVNTRDWPQLNSKWGAQLGPVFSFSKTKEYYDIMYPAWSFWEGGPAIKLYPTGLGKWESHRESLTKAADKWPWEQKKPVAFFRGSRTSDERDPIVLLSRAKPDLVDAKYTKNQAWKSDADTLYAPPADEVSLEDHCQYRYLFNYRGVAASFRFKHLFLCKSLVFHVGDEWLEFFYPSLKPWVHYIPVSSKATQDDIEDLVNFFIENDWMAQDIAHRGYQHIWDHLKMSDVKCYWRRLIKNYSKLVTYKVERDEELIEIKGKN